MKLNKMKKCTKCGEMLPLTAFHKHSKTSDGLAKVCKFCRSEKNGTPQPEVKLERNPDLEGFTNRMLFDEIKARGFSGDLFYTPPVEVKKVTL